MNTNTPLIDWDSPNWGQPGHNTHESTSGIPDRHETSSGGES